MLAELARTKEKFSINTGTNEVMMKESHLNLGCVNAADCSNPPEQTPAVDGLLDQELEAREVNPMKLVTSLRVRFGIGRYEIQSSESGITTSFEYQHFFQRRTSKNAVGIDAEESNRGPRIIWWFTRRKENMSSGWYN
ncbi:hypothetical protein IFR04_009877 [Cadophora malorum]|uniref:Uncharacterized protein n=1 Tax=Cadophora malorum TaxID=108018 RepID=A0A8H7TD49_9HELO|nr:hypothetical protein IFR04_009877 [Cadophora malorum]